MSASNPEFGGSDASKPAIPRQSVVGMEGMWVKMFDPPTQSPLTPDKLAPTNPVPEVMAAAGLQNTPSVPHTVMRDLLHSVNMATWDNRPGGMNFMLMRDVDNPTAVGTFPAPTLRVPRGVVFHGETQGHGPPPHTIHWHGIEPTPINDGVGHCSMEVGHYTYQWQPNFIGFYFYHCHRNTVQHFEFGLYGALLIEPPDAYFATQWNPSIPIGACRDGKRRVAANLSNIRGPTGGGVPLRPTSGAGFEGAIIPNPFPGFNSNPLTAPDPEALNPDLPDYLKFPTDPHALTVPYDVDALWVVDDRDSRWSDLAPNARATYPLQGSIPGVNDNFAGNWGGSVGPGDFFAFNDFHTDYWYVTGVPVPAARVDKGGTGVGTIPEGIVIPAALNSGVSGTQVSVNARMGQTILVRVLDAAYNCVAYTFPVDITIIAWDGRALGVPPYGEYNHAYQVPAGTRIHASVARRFDALIRSDVPVNDFATVEFIDTRGQVPGFPEQVLMTAKIPIVITAPAAGGAVLGTVTKDSSVFSGVTITVTGAATMTTVTDKDGKYSLDGLPNGDYTITPSFPGKAFTPASTNVTISGADVADVDFAKAEPPGASSISGGVVGKRSGTPVPGVQINLIGPVSSVAVSDVFGNYSFTGLPDGRYTIVPSHKDWRLSPRQRKVTVRDGDQIGQYFNARQL